MKYSESNQVDTVRCFACKKAIFEPVSYVEQAGHAHNCVDSVVTVLVDVDSDTLQLFHSGD